MTNYSFADLLHIFFRFQQDPIDRQTQDDLASTIRVGRRTVANWFSGNYVPRSRDIAERLAQALTLTPFQTDLLLYSINPTWVKYGTPSDILESTEVIRYREEDIPYERVIQEAVPPFRQIEHDWNVVFEDPFVNNHQRWGCGIKENGYCRLERRIESGAYRLAVDNYFHDGVFIGGDSACFAPDVYYLTVHAQLLDGATEDENYTVVFEEVSDECHAIFRVRERMQCVSVVQTLNGGRDYTIYLRQAPAPMLRPRAENKLAILAIGQDHWFYVNNQLIDRRVIPRLPSSRLDVGIAAGGNQRAVCQFRQFRVAVPPATRLYPTLEGIAGRLLT